VLNVCLFRIQDRIEVSGVTLYGRRLAAGGRSASYVSHFTPHLLHALNSSTNHSLPVGRPTRSFLIIAGLLVLCFYKPLLDWARFSFHSDLYSHALLIPLVTGYLIWCKRRELPAFGRGPVLPAGIPALIGAGLLLLYGVGLQRGWKLSENDYLSIMMLAFLCLLVAGAVLFLGLRTMRAIAFPTAFLLFMVPFPSVVERGIEIFFQHTSAAAAHALFALSGTPYLRDGLSFRLPDISIRVGEECSGIHSSLALFITSVLAGHLFFRSSWKRSLLALAVIPLGIIRNGFRIFTIAMLCVHVNPDMINSPIHRRGGPVFFLLSLIPFSLLLYVLWRLERKEKL
jgi:exosortase C (VPDSG-CTERM-specific)